MKDDQLAIVNRPLALEEQQFYNEFPNEPFVIGSLTGVSSFLEYDLFELDGVQPVELKHLEINDGLIGVNLSEASCGVYKERGVEFQLIHVVVNVCGFEEIDGVLHGIPYHVSLFPSSKRGMVQEVTPDFVRKIDLEMLGQIPSYYAGYNPFKNRYGFYVLGDDMTFMRSQYPDMVGFVRSLFVLANDYDHNDIAVSGDAPFLRDKKVRNDFNKYRRKWYFKAFENIKPRKIWGCDSPIELFLLQAMRYAGLSPSIQVMISKDGLIAPAFHSLWEDQLLRKYMKTITEADFYFEEKKVAIFCDSKEFHDNEDVKKKDARIDDELKQLGITSLRFSGREIVSSPFDCVETIQKAVR